MKKTVGCGDNGGEVLCMLDYMLCRRLWGDNGGEVPCKKSGLSYMTTNLSRQQVSILCPQGYEPCALPLRHTGNTILKFVGRVSYDRRFL